MTDSVSLRLPYPPSVNTYWRRAGMHMHISNEGRKYIENVAASVVKQRHSLKLVFKDERLNVRIVATMPDKRKRDLDNILKSLLDSLTKAGLWQDDGQIDHIDVERGDVDSPGWVDVTILPMSETTPPHRNLDELSTAKSENRKA